MTCKAKSINRNLRRLRFLFEYVKYKLYLICSISSTFYSLPYQREVGGIINMVGGWTPLQAGLDLPTRQNKKSSLTGGRI